MSSESQACLALSLEGPLQSWGFEDRFNLRKTGLLPTKSGLLGLCCAALGAPRGSAKETEWLAKLNALDCLIIAIQRPDRRRESAPSLTVRRMEDFHTVQNTRKAKGGIKETHITHRTYLNDARFSVVLSGDAPVIQQLSVALVDPVWGIWLGRKACIPSAPLLRGVFESEAAALDSLLAGRSLSAFTHQREAKTFQDGTDTFMDTPVTFGDPRQFTPRRVKLLRAGQSDE